MTSGARTIIYPTKDLAAATRTFRALLGAEPVVEMPYYVQFSDAGQDIGLDPNGHAAGLVGPTAALARGRPAGDARPPRRGRARPSSSRRATSATDGSSRVSSTSTATRSGCCRTPEPRGRGWLRRGTAPAAIPDPVQRVERLRHQRGHPDEAVDLTRVLDADHLDPRPFQGVGVVPAVVAERSNPAVTTSAGGRPRRSAADSTGTPSGA